MHDIAQKWIFSKTTLAGFGSGFGEVSGSATLTKCKKIISQQKLAKIKQFLPISLKETSYSSN
jgi:hypothetical protein